MPIRSDLLALAAACWLASPAWLPAPWLPVNAAEPRKPQAAGRSGVAAGSPRAIGRFDDWTAATHQEAGQPVCYAFARATASNPTLAGRGDVVLTVSERATARDAVAISAGFTYAANAAVKVAVEQTALEFYTAQRSAFAHDGRAAVVAFQRGRQVVARSPGPRGVAVADMFSLRGFSAAYAAAQKACPVKAAS